MPPPASLKFRKYVLNKYPNYFCGIWGMCPKGGGGQRPPHPRFSFSEFQKTVSQNYGEREQRKPMPKSEFEGLYLLRVEERTL